MEETIKELTILDNLTSTSFSIGLESPEEKYEWIKDMMDSYGYPYDITSEGLIFKYPDTICTDIYGNQEPITDLYIKLLFGLRNSDDLKRPYFIRLSGTIKQINNNYLHSHLSGKFNDWTNTLCFGSSVNINFRDFDTALIMLITNLDLFLKTESSNHSPYKHIARLNQTLSGEIHYSSYSNSLYKKYLNEVKELILVKTQDGYKLDVVLNNNIDESLIQNGIVSYYMNGKWFNDSVADSLHKQLNIKDNHFVFQNDLVEFKIIDASNEKKVKLPCGKFKEGIIQYINNKFNESKSYEHWVITLGTTRN